MTSLEWALDLWRRGLSVIPIPRPRPGVAPGAPGDGKTPDIPWKIRQSQPATEVELKKYFEHEQNVAIVTGAVSNVVVVDVDSTDALAWVRRNLPWTPWQTKTPRGFHLFYRHPGIKVSNRSHIETRDGRLDLDVRGDAGYVIAPGSVHATGTTYEQAGDWCVVRDQLPVFWVGWLRRPKQRTTTSVPRRERPSGDIIERARRYLKAIPPPEIGEGSDTATLSAACRVVRGFDLNEADAAAVIFDWCGNRPGWSFAYVQRKCHNAARYGTEPMGALR